MPYLGHLDKRKTFLRPWGEKKREREMSERERERESERERETARKAPIHPEPTKVSFTRQINISEACR